MSCLPLR